MKSNEEIWYKTIATAFLSGELTFFVGTGFSKHITDSRAPSWLELLYKVAKNVEVKLSKDVVKDLFKINPSGGLEEAKYDLFICAQMIENFCTNNQLNFREEIAIIIMETTEGECVRENKVTNIREIFTEFNENGKNSINVVTTNYDRILSEYIFGGHANTFCEDRHNRVKLVGYPNVYHIHGMVSYSESIVITMNDYFKFQSIDSFMTRKLYNLVEEKIVVILGYSLNDFNINKIFNDVNFSKKRYAGEKEIFYVVRSEVADQIKEYYLSCYGINVIDNTEIDDFFKAVSREKESAKIITESANDVLQVIDSSKEFEEDYLKLYNTFNDILASVIAVGKSFNDKQVITMLLKQLEKKRSFTSENGAFIQYESLALWLVQFINNITIDALDNEAEKQFEALIVYSFSKMSKEYRLGYSWNAHRIWQDNWEGVAESKQKYIEKIIDKNDYRFMAFNGVESILNCGEKEQLAGMSE